MDDVVDMTELESVEVDCFELAVVDMVSVIVISVVDMEEELDCVELAVVDMVSVVIESVVDMLEELDWVELIIVEVIVDKHPQAEFSAAVTPLQLAKTAGMTGKVLG